MIARPSMLLILIGESFALLGARSSPTLENSPAIHLKTSKPFRIGGRLVRPVDGGTEENYQHAPDTSHGKILDSISLRPFLRHCPCHQGSPSRDKARTDIPFKTRQSMSFPQQSPLVVWVPKREEPSRNDNELASFALRTGNRMGIEFPKIPFPIYSRIRGVVCGATRPGCIPHIFFRKPPSPPFDPRPFYQKPAIQINFEL